MSAATSRLLKKIFPARLNLTLPVVIDHAIRLPGLPRNCWLMTLTQPHRHCGATSRGPARIAFTRLHSSEEEGDYVLHIVDSLLGGSKNASYDHIGIGDGDGIQLGYGDIAVLYRTPEDGEAVYQALLNAQLPCRRATLSTAYQHPQQRQIMALLQLANTPTSPARFELLLQAGLPGLSEKLALRLQRKLAVMNPWYQSVIDRLCAQYPREAILRQLQKSLLVMHDARSLSPEQCLQYAAKYFGISQHELAVDYWQVFVDRARQAATLAEMLADFAQDEDADLCDPLLNRLTLATIHAARCCEWQVVILLGNQLGNQEYHNAAFAEERRLWYHAVTRARRYIFISSLVPTSWKDEDDYFPPFLHDISKELLYTRPAPSKKRAVKYTQLKMDW